MEREKIEKIQKLLNEKEELLSEILELTQSGDLTSSIIDRKEELIFKAESIDEDFISEYDIRELDMHQPREDVKLIKHRVKQILYLTEEIQKQEEYNYNRNQKKHKNFKKKLRDTKPAKKSVNRYKEVENQYNRDKLS